MDKFLTIKTASQGEYKERKSSFLAFAYPVSDAEQVKDLVANLKKEYYDARHHCYAWRIGVENQAQYRTFDDREPAHSAGDMIFSAIESNNLTNILIVVVRYFGGIKLGASNLAKAYKTSAQEAINNAEIIEKTIEAQIRFSFDYSLMAKVNKFLKDNNLNKENYTFVSGNEILLTFPQDFYNNYLAQLQAIYGINLL
ncbi:MAG: YigZ family protein [Bacteroidales bacterium]|nr:YigZ family protein [Bacteroidales bacterium]